MEAQSKGDDIAFAVALKKGIRYFEDALRGNEDAIRKSENTIRSEMEDYIRTFEDAIREHESEKKDRDERMAFHNDRMRVHDLRMEAHNSRMTIHDARMGIHDTRMQFHDDRMQAHDILMKAFEKEFFAALEADGLSNKGASELDFMAEPGKITVNGRTLSDQQAQKYFRMLEKYGFEIPADGHFIFKISEDSRRIGTTSGYSESSKKKE